MKVKFKSFRFGALCTNQKELVRKYGRPVAEKVTTRLFQLTSVATLEEMQHLPGRCHELTADRKGELAVVLHGGFRLFFAPGEHSRRRERGAGLVIGNRSNRDGDRGLPLAVAHLEGENDGRIASVI